MTLYLKVTKDEYELPLAVADTVAELARMCKVSISCISHAFADEKYKGRKSAYIKVEVDEDD